jgi:hypothetical protein
MKSHNGMRPQDIPILIKILTIKELDWQYRDLATSLYLSLSEISESLQRSHLAGLVDPTKRQVHRQALMEFLRYGVQYVFPLAPGTMVTGIPTAHSYPSYRNMIIGGLDYVWPDLEGNMRGLEIQPLYKSVVKAVKEDEQLYKLLASIDMIRVGRAREVKLAIEELQKNIL